MQRHCDMLDLVFPLNLDAGASKEEDSNFLLIRASNDVLISGVYS